MALSGESYYEKIASIQRSMQENAKRRQELEQKLLDLSMPDETASQIKYSKLCSYLKEICDREARAKKRNLELVKHVECIEMNMKDSCHDRGPLQQQKAESLQKILKFVDEQKEKGKDLATAKSEAPHKEQQDDSTQLPGKPSMSSSREADPHPVDLPRASHPPSGPLKDFRGGSDDASSKPTPLSDDISGSSDKHERISVQVVSGDAADAPVRTVDDPQPSPSLTLTEPEKNLSPSHSPVSPRNSPAEKLLEAVHRSNITENPERGVTDFMPETTLGQQSHDAPGSHQNAIAPSSDEELSESSESYISISLTQSESEEDPAEDAQLSDRSNTQQRTPQSSVQLDEQNTEPHSICDAAAAAAGMTVESLSQEGLFNLLESIEGRLHGKYACVYTDSSVNGKSLNRIISLCNSGSDLRDEDLEACGSVVLREIQRLSWSSRDGCLLPPNVLTAPPPRPNAGPEVISTSLPPDAARLWDRWFKHALLLKEQRVLTVERLVQLFTPLLVERHATYSQQAKVLLRTLLSTEECCSAREESEPPSSSSSSSSSSSTGGLPAAPDEKRAAVKEKPQIQELQSSEEDSQDESPVESVPIRATKAYQRLKQSAMQERVNSSEEEEEVSGINDSDEEDLGRDDGSSHQHPHPRTTGKTNSKRLYAAQSKDFWGESDDSNSEIEAALRPRSLAADTDDFYD